MLGHRLRRWPNIKPSLFQRIVFVLPRLPEHAGNHASTNISRTRKLGSAGMYLAYCIGCGGLLALYGRHTDVYVLTPGP